MKLIHLSDLHLGKRVNEFSMLEDQKYILREILEIIDREKPQIILIAGDVYDKSVPPAEAVELFDDFLVRLARRKLQVFVISGNHDSAERIAFGGRLMDQSGIHMSPVYSGRVEPITLEDEHGPLHIYMLPFIKPAHVRRFFPDREIVTYTDAARVAVEEMHIDESERNLLMTHQFVTGASRTESEEITVGGTDNIDASAFDGFDYVALGHIHRAQTCGADHIRYCGTPLKYSFSEAGDEKTVTILDMGEKGHIDYQFVPLKPLRDLVEIRGSYAQLTDKSFYENTTYNEDYMHVTLTDEEDVPEALSRLRLVYHNIMKLDYDNRRTRHQAQLDGGADVQHLSPFEQFSEFYRLQNGQSMSEEQSEFLRQMMEEIWEDEQ